MRKFMGVLAILAAAGGMVFQPAPAAQRNVKPRAAAEKHPSDAAGLEAGRINRLAFHPATPNIMYAGASSGGVFRSTNGGDSWVLSSTGITDPQIGGLLVFPPNPSVVLACTPSGIFRSANNGQGWTRVLAAERELPPPDAPHPLFELQKSPVRYDGAAKVLYAAPWGAGLFKSTDAGLTWTKVYGGDIRDAKERVILDIEFSAESGGTVFITTLGGIKKYQRSTWSDDGKEIVSPKSHKRLNPVCIRVAPSDAKRIYVTASNLEGSPLETSVWRRDAPGGPFVLAAAASKTWPSWSILQCLVIDPHDANRLWAGGVTLGHSVDGGRTWTDAPKEFDCHDSTICGVDYRDLVLDPTGQVLYAAHDQGIFRYDFKSRLAKAAEKGLANNQFYDLDIGPGGTLYGGTQDTGAYRRKAGSSWERIGDAGAGDILGITADSQDDSRVFVRTNAEQLVIGSKYGDTDASSAGLLSCAFWNHQLLYLPAGREIYAGTEYRGVFKSKDGGRTFAPANDGIAELNIRCLAAAPGNAKELFAGSLKDGVYRTEDGGAKWQKLPGFPASAAPLVLKPLAGGTVYAGTSEGIYVSKDKGASWTAQNRGLPARRVVSELAVDPHSPTCLYAGLGYYSIEGLYGGGVYFSRDGGAEWIPLDAGRMKSMSVTSIRVDPKDDSRVWVATYGSGVLAIAKGR